MSRYSEGVRAYFVCDKRPKNNRLAKDVPEKGMHGFLPRLNSEAAYWQQRQHQAFNTGDTAIYDQAEVLAANLHGCINAVSLWVGYGAVDKMLTRAHPYWHQWNNFRRDTLGVIALSLLCRDIFPEREQVGDVRALSEEEQPETAKTILVEPSGRNEQDKPLDTRVHLPPEVADDLLGSFRASRPWHQRGDGLFVRRTATAIPTTPFMIQIMAMTADKNIPVKFDAMQTLFPYLSARR